jgi:hypothetical protein
VAAKPEEGKPARPSAAPVIRKLVVAMEDGHDRLLKRQVPAWVISGLIHVVLISAFIFFDWYFDKGPTLKAKNNSPTSTKLDDKDDKDKDLTNPDPGLDPDIVATTVTDRDGPLNVVAPVDSNEAAGLPNHEKEFASNATNPGELSPLFQSGNISSPTETGLVATGVGSGGAPMVMGGLGSRVGATKEKLLRDRGGNDDTEAAVARALAWLAKQQNLSGGFWEYDGGAKLNRIAATGMCLLPFLAAGETHKSAKKYQKTVATGLDYLKGQIQLNGELHPNMYAHAIGTVALCEAAGMTKDESLKQFARRAVDYIIKAQAGNGSWGYQAGAEGDTSIVGWQIQALKSARLADIPVPEQSFRQAANFLESVSSDYGATYGYRSKGSTYTLSAVGLLCRQYMGWNPKNPSLAKGVDLLWTKNPPNEKDFDIYYYYYATQVVHFFDGPAWRRDWNPKMRGILLDKQLTEKNNAKAGDIGSWPRDDGPHLGNQCGKLGTTALACLTLEVYYRHLPLYKRDNGGLQAIDK